ncbi:cellulose biosynthesis cyclic di-GMP-binding regulatory protein BcsB [Kosakonia oryzae]|uniref:Cyclic di-GMP-binding protein n=1 Tax=Kosakonia oryzae TaxID=497725 RepID=A0AA94H7I0_9ENTR|nr:cellulose biosynthesis cyclic di-GMP-binding regulatory protein BcsB [Kosakonia oryzae]ANI80776.1 cellulose biosynthesis cyclic di-GMP-binding regulatory protein BcsB [Kosakonia oryzae]UDJ82704.1 cellulose biosynthesis cyclic di-GMP-binding regulatory protein BcsB [Kosakonia oryzae]SFD19524.1 cellulose synthase subunit [Kosakonia oryzae]
MKRLTTLAMLVGTLFMAPLHSEETTVSSLLPVDLPPPTAAQSASAFVPSVVSSVSLAQMGQPQGLTLSGGQFQGGVDFTLPMDQVITNARLALNLKISPAMAARNATLQLMLNGQPLGTVPLTATDSDLSRYQLDIPAALMVSSNNLSFKINDGDAMQCQRDLNDKYRVTVLPDSRFELEGQQLDIGTDLSHFPRPFFDSMQMSPTSIAMAFGSTLSADAISAGALISSWMGIQADYRGISFAVYHDRLPEQNGILIGHPGEQIGGLTLPQTTQPLLKIIDNPANPVYKLLLVVGKDEHELRAAAWRLTRGNFTPQTSALDVTAQTIPLSKPYDAPRWIPTDRPIKLHELIRKDQTLTATGIWHSPLQVAFRAAPDLFLWDGETIPLHIGYRFPTENWIDEQRSWLSMTMNDTFLHNLPVNKQGALETLWHKLGGDARQESFDMPLEPYMIYGDNQLSLYFNIVPKANAPCSTLLNNNIKSRIDDDSWIDLSHTRHFALLPNLSYFVGASFPFTRMADYAETVLMLPQNPSETQLATLLDMAARSGNATGTALGHNRVLLGVPTGGGLRELVRDRDVLAVTGMDQHDFNQALLADSPFTTHDNTLGVRAPSLWQKVQRWMAGDWAAEGLEADRYFSSNEAWRGFISFRSPWNDERLVVLALGSSDEQLSHLHSDLASARINAGIRGDAAIITNENGVRSFRVGEQFPSGQMPPQMMVVWYANQHSALLAILGLLVGSLAGWLFYLALKKRERKRLHPENSK